MSSLLVSPPRMIRTAMPSAPARICRQDTAFETPPRTVAFSLMCDDDATGNDASFATPTRPVAFNLFGSCAPAAPARVARNEEAEFVTPTRPVAFNLFGSCAPAAPARVIRNEEAEFVTPARLRPEALFANYHVEGRVLQRAPGAPARVIRYTVATV
jgi:hypothetical protein